VKKGGVMKEDKMREDYDEIDLERTMMR